MVYTAVEPLRRHWRGQPGWLIAIEIFVALGVLVIVLESLGIIDTNPESAEIPTKADQDCASLLHAKDVEEACKVDLVLYGSVPLGERGCRHQARAQVGTANSGYWQLDTQFDVRHFEDADFPFANRDVAVMHEDEHVIVTRYPFVLDSGSGGGCSAKQIERLLVLMADRLTEKLAAPGSD